MRVLDLKALEQKIPFKETRIRELMKEDPSFPVPVKIGGRKLCFVEAEVEIWLRSHFDRRPSAAKARV